MKKSRLLAPAKINLWLKITDVRDDGYHELDSLFTPIDLYDELHFYLDTAGLTQDQVQYQSPDGAALQFDGDTVSKAIKLMRFLIPKMPRVKIVIKKSIPVGAGLGGGSTDAASTLKFLQSAYGNGHTETELPRLAKTIGADVPFFLSSRPSHVSGIGEVLKNSEMEMLHVLVIYPGVHVSTKQAYGWFDEDCALTRDASNVTRFSKAGVSKDSNLTADQIVADLYNDLEKPVEARHPEIANLKKALSKRGARGSLMSGSGSSVFGIFRSSQEAHKALGEMKLEFPPSHRFFVCKTLV